MHVDNVKNYDSLSLDRAKESINQPSMHHSIKCNRVLLCYCFKLFVDHMWRFCHMCSLYSLSLFPKAKASRLRGQGRELWNLTSSQNQMGRLLLSRFTKESVSRILNLHSSCALHKGSPRNKFSVKLGNLAQPAWPPLPVRWDFSVIFFGNFRQKRVKYAIKTVIYKSWDWVRPPPPWAKFPTFTENLFWKLP